LPCLAGGDTSCAPPKPAPCCMPPGEWCLAVAMELRVPLRMVDRRGAGAALGGAAAGDELAVEAAPRNPDEPICAFQSAITHPRANPAYHSRCKTPA